MNTSVPVIVVYRGGIGVLALARSLGRLGIPTYLIAEKGTTSPVVHSRYWVKKWWCDFSSPEETLELFFQIGRQFETRPILLTFADWVAIFIEEHASELEKVYRFPRPDTPVVRRLAEKGQMYLLAKQHGIPVPETLRPHSRDDVQAFLTRAKFPVIVKGADPLLPRAAAKRITRDANELLAAYDEAAESGVPNVVLQEYIPGDVQDVWMCNAYFGAGSQCKAIYTGRKIRQVSETGIASLAVCERNETVERQTRKFMQAVGYQGAVGIGWRYDARDGQYKVLDVNARVSGVFRLFRGTHGMDVVRVCYLDLTDQPIPPSILTAGRKWMLEEDFFSALAAARAGKLTFKQWITSIWGVKETHWFAFDDPVPAAAWFATNVWPVCLSALRKLRAQSFGGKRYVGGGTTGDPTSSTIC